MSVIFKALKKIKNQQFEQQHNHKIQINDKKNSAQNLLNVSKIITTFIACLAIVSFFSLLLITYLNTVKNKNFKQKKIYANQLKEKINHNNKELLSQIKGKKNNETAKDKRIEVEVERTNNIKPKNEFVNNIINNEINKNDNNKNEIIDTNIGSLENIVTFIPANADIRNSYSNIQNKENKIIQNSDDTSKNLKQFIDQNNKKNIYQNITQTKKAIETKETINNNLDYSPQKIISKNNQLNDFDIKKKPDNKYIANKPEFLNLNNNSSRRPTSFPKKQKHLKRIKQGKEKDKTKIITEKNQIKSIEKSKSQINSTISKIVQQVRMQIKKKNHAKVSEYLKQLEKIKGNNNIFLLKLKAFWHIKTGEYNIAEKLLNDVLNINKDDLEASINMAVIDINQNRINQARERLHNLQQVYPNNSKILNIIKVLN